MWLRVLDTYLQIIRTSSKTIYYRLFLWKVSLLHSWIKEVVTEVSSVFQVVSFKKYSLSWFSRTSSAGKESACNAGDPNLIPRLGRSPGEGVGYPLQYSGASLVAQLVKNPPAMLEIWFRSLDWEDPLEKGMATHPCSCLENSMDWGAWWATVHGVAKSCIWLSN